MWLRFPIFFDILCGFKLLRRNCWIPLLLCSVRFIVISLLVHNFLMGDFNVAVLRHTSFQFANSRRFHDFCIIEVRNPESCWVNRRGTLHQCVSSKHVAKEDFPILSMACLLGYNLRWFLTCEQSCVTVSLLLRCSTLLTRRWLSCKSTSSTSIISPVSAPKKCLKKKLKSKTIATPVSSG